MLIKYSDYQMTNAEIDIPFLMDSHSISPPLQEYFERCIDFHTYPAPGLLIGVFMVDYALELLGAAPGEKLYAVCETHKCAPDPLQVILRCTYGNHRLRVIPMGRFAMTLNRPSTEPFTEGIRVFIDPGKIEKYPLIKAWFTNDPLFSQRSMALPLIDEIFKAGRAILSSRKGPRESHPEAEVEVREMPGLWRDGSGRPARKGCMSRMRSECILRKDRNGSLNSSSPEVRVGDE